METVGQLRKAVVFHLYYHELWEKIKPYLLNLQEIGAFDLYITTPVENKELFNSIKQSVCTRDILHEISGYFLTFLHSIYRNFISKLKRPS